MVNQDAPRLPSQLREGEWMVLAWGNPAFGVTFSRENSHLEASFSKIGGPECDVTHLDEEVLDRWFLDLGAAGAQIRTTHFTMPEKRKPWEI